jgi:hypothetical protein
MLPTEDNVVIDLSINSVQVHADIDLLFQSSVPPSALASGINLLVRSIFQRLLPLTAVFLMLSNRSPWFTNLAAYVWAIVPPLTLILILGADWFMHKIGIPRTSVKILFNLIFLLILSLFVNLALWQALVPPPIHI